ncbi:PLD nuclease N-terminal domain-containing protein [Agromyces sp. G08B096]|uniref:PLD nuclease N-terminal domain-containing protein n=1 Tax=Agromyces sp. G08B096 TaxID=3156399 RepID=A0AAU7W927_9MICO
MVRLAIPLVVAAVVFMIYAVVDCALFDRSRIRGLPRGWWIVVILLVPVIGAALWFIIGRGRARGAARGVPRGGQVAPDDDTEFLRRLERDAEQEERIRRLEQELADLDSEPGDAGTDAEGRGADGPGAPHEHKRPDAPDPGDSGSTGRPNG